MHRRCAVRGVQNNHWPVSAPYIMYYGPWGSSSVTCRSFSKHDARCVGVLNVYLAVFVPVCRLSHEDPRGARVGGRGRRGRAGRGGLQAARRPRARAAAAGARRHRPAPLGGAPGPPRAAVRVPRRAPHQPRPHQALAQVNYTPVYSFKRMR